MENLRVRAVPPPHCEDLLAEELTLRGLTVSSSTPRGVEFTANLEPVYELLIENRTATRIIFPVKIFTTGSAEQLYRTIHDIPWEDHLDSSCSFRIDSNIKSDLFRHTTYPVMKVKDAVVDRLRDRYGTRPDIDQDNPGLVLYLRIYKDEVEISIDIGGGSLHRRGYRRFGGGAPLKENLAAALLVRADWPKIAAEGGSFYDPFCGSGTLCIEAAMMAAGIVPGLHRPSHSSGWKFRDPAAIEHLVSTYRQQNIQNLKALAEKECRVFGSDLDPKAVEGAKQNAEAAGLADAICFTTAPVHQARPPAGLSAGLVATNPPYGERLESTVQAEVIYSDFGLTMRRFFPGWRTSFLSPSKELGLATGIHAAKIHKLANGTIPVQLVHGLIEAYTMPKGTEMFVNRLKKNRASLKSYLKAGDVSCYRLYDKDMPEYAFAVDIYDDRWCHLQEYAAPPEIEPGKVRRRRREAVEGLMRNLDIGSEGIFLKERRKLGARDRYSKQDGKGRRVICREGDLKFFINLTDYLDTGLFLDGRELRKLIRREAAGGRFLNLFAYTCSATVAAAAGGAVESLSVDTSGRYLAWGADNLRLNRIDTRAHRSHEGDVLQFLNSPAAKSTGFDLAYVDPPTYSNSKDRRQDFDVQRDHQRLIDAVARSMNPRGTIIFCTNFTRFEPSRELFEQFSIEEITSTTIPPDFSRKSGIHRSFRISLV